MINFSPQLDTLSLPLMVSHSTSLSKKKKRTENLANLTLKPTFCFFPPLLCVCILQKRVLRKGSCGEVGCILGFIDLGLIQEASWGFCRSHDLD